MDPLVAAFATITSASADSERLMCWASSNSEASWGAGHEQCQNFLNPDAEDFLDRNTHQTNVQQHYTRNPNIIIKLYNPKRCKAVGGGGGGGGVVGGGGGGNALQASIQDLSQIRDLDPKTPSSQSTTARVG